MITDWTAIMPSQNKDLESHIKDLQAKNPYSMDLATQVGKVLKTYQEKRGQDYLIVARLQKYLGEIYYKNDHLGEALEYFKETLRIFKDFKEKTPDSLEVANYLNNIGLIYCKQNNLDKALEVFKESLK